MFSIVQYYLQNTGVFPLSHPGLIPLSEPLLTRWPVLIIYNMLWKDFIISIIKYDMKKIQPVYDNYTVMYSYFDYFVFKVCINKSQSVNVSLRLELQQTEFKLESTEVSEKIEKSTKCACFIICNYLVFSLLSTQINKCQIIWFNTLNWLCWYLMIKVLQQYFILSHK